MNAPSREDWPTTVDEAVEMVLQSLTQDWRDTLLHGTRQAAQGRNFTLGLWIRNRFGMWRGNRELLLDVIRRSEDDPKADGKMDADFAAYFILGVVWDRLQESQEEGADPE